MVARAMRRSAESGMSAEAFGALMANKAEFDVALKRFTERKGEAEAAEVKAGERGRGQAAREAALDLREQQLDEKIAAFGEREAAFKSWSGGITSWVDGWKGDA